MKLAALLLQLHLAFFCLGQKSSSFQLIRTYAGSITDAAIDNLENVYVVSATDQLKKFSPNGDSVAVYNNVRRFGKLTAMDVSNPLKLLLFYKDFSSIVILDRLLAIRSSIDLRRTNMLQVTAVGLSYDNNIWLFDALENKLKKINEEGQVLLETPDLRLVFNESISPQQIIDRNKQVHLYDSTKGLYVFDQYGTFKRKMPLSGWENISVTEKQILGTSNNALQVYQPSTLMHTHQPLPPHFSSYYRYFLSHNKLLALSPKGLFIYGF